MSFLGCEPWNGFIRRLFVDWLNEYETRSVPFDLPKYSTTWLFKVKIICSKSTLNYSRFCLVAFVIRLHVSIRHSVHVVSSEDIGYNLTKLLIMVVLVFQYLMNHDTAYHMIQALDYLFIR